MNRIITEITVLLLLTFGICGSVVASPAISNLSSSSATISWTTTDSVDATVRYGLTTSLGDSVIDATVDDVHMVTISGLSAETQYYFDVRSGAEVDNNNGAYYTFTTSEIGVGLPYIVHGYVEDRVSSTPLERALVRVSVTNNTGNLSQPLSALTDASGNWYVNIGNLKDTATNAAYAYSTGNTILIQAIGSINDEVYDTLLISGASPQNIGLISLGGCCGAYTGGQTGNTDCDVDGKRNLADITRLIDRVYISKAELCCEEEGNVDGDAEAKINLADITRLIDHVYISKGETEPCQ